MVHRRVRPLALTVFVAAIAACSASSANKAGDSGADAGEVNPREDVGSPDAKAEEATREGTDAGKLDDAGPLDASDEDASVNDASSRAQCPPGGTSELEPNSTNLQATPAAATAPFCGHVRDTGDLDDWFQFPMPAGKTMFKVKVDCDRPANLQVGTLVQGATAYVSIHVLPSRRDENGNAIYDTGPDLAVRYLGEVTFE